MSKRFRDPVAPPGQIYLLPPAVEDWVRPEASVRALSEIIDGLDCSKLYGEYPGGGAPAYDPRRLLKVLIYGYSQGIRSSRKLALALERDLHFMWLARMDRPEFNTLARFRRRHEEAIGQLFRQTVDLASDLGLVLLEHVAVDGTKLEANVSGKETYSAARLKRSLTSVEEKIQQVLKEAEAQDAAEDAQLGMRRGDELPPELADLNERKKRLEALRERQEQSGQQCVAATDPQSRLMKTTAGNRPAYNAQAAVDATNQIIVAAQVRQEPTDNALFEPVMEQVARTMGRQPAAVTADGGYFSHGTLQYAKTQGVNAHIALAPATGTHKIGEYAYDALSDTYVLPDGTVLKFDCIKRKGVLIYRRYRSRGKPPKEILIREDEGLADQMRARMQTDQGRATYRLRKQIVEPVFGHLKGPMQLRRLLLRGLQGATIEYLLACSAHNLLKCIPTYTQRIAAYAA